MTLKYRPLRMILAAIFVATIAIVCAMFALDVPEPNRSGRYAALHGVMGQTGMMVLLLGLAAIFAHCAVKLVLLLASGCVAAEIEDTGVRLRSAGYPITLTWADIYGVERKEIGGRNKMPVVVLHHAPKRAGLIASRRNSTLIPRLLAADEWEFENWLTRVEAQIASESQVRNVARPA